jgi:methylmalonyl-CoA mutase N-terminal domain/subunit
MSADRPTHTPKDSHYATLRRAYRDAKPGAKAEGGEKPRGERPSHPGKPGPDANVLYPMRDALRARATVGEVCGALRDVWGRYVPRDAF